MSIRLFCAFLFGLVCAAIAPLLLKASTESLRAAASKPPSASLALQLATAQLKLAEATLAKVAQTNQRSARTVPADVVAQYQRDVELAKVQRAAVEGGAALGDFAVWLGRAEAALKTANREWKAGLDVNRRAPGSLDSIDLSRLKLRAEVARLNLEQGRSLAKASPQEQVRWQLELLNGEVARLKQQLLRSTPTSQYFPLWPY